MIKRKQNIYLSELFMEKLNGDLSHKAVLKALEICNDEILQRMGKYFNYSIYGKKQKRKISKQMKQELVDFWDVYGEFDDMLKPDVKKKYLILQMI